MAHVSCNLLPNFVVEQFIYPPYEEAKNQISYAFFQSKVGEEAQAVEGPSLIGRLVHLVEGLILMIPVVNWVVYVAMQYFSLTITGQFQYAVEAGDRDHVEFYLNLGFNPDTVNAEGKPLIIVAAEKGRNEIVQLFLEHSANANASFEGTPLIHTLIQKEEYELAKDAIRQYGADSALLDAEGRTILQVLYDKNYDEFLPFINEGIVHPNLMNAQGDTILHHILKSIAGGDCEEHGQVIGGILALAEKDVDLNIRSGSTKQTPLWMAYQKLGVDAAIALMNYGAQPNEQGDLNELYPGASNLFQVVWIDRSYETLLWTTALKHGARIPSAGDFDSFAVCNVVRQLDREVLEELYNSQEEEQARFNLLKAMDDAGWGTFTKAYQFRDTWGDNAWIGLLEHGVRLPQDGGVINVDAIMTQVLNNVGLQVQAERRTKLLLTMQQAGWEMVRLAYQLQMDDDTFMLLRHGARPPAVAMNQTQLITKVITSPHKKEIIPIMIENGWNFQAFCDEAVRRSDYDGVRFAIEMGMEVPTLNWLTARDTADFRTKVVLPANADVIPHRGLGGMVGLGGLNTEDQFITQFLINIQQHNDSAAMPKINPLEVMLFIHSQEGVKRVMRQSSFEQFSQMLTHVVTEYPRINIEWFWADLLEIPPSHYANYATVKGGADELPDLPYRVPIDTLLPFFDRINFNHSDEPHYKDEKARKDQGVAYSPAAIRDGVGSIIRRINHNLPDAVAPHDASARALYYADHRKHLEAVAYYMQLKWDDKGNPIPDSDRPGEFLREDPHAREPLHSTKAAVLIDLGRTGKMCSGRWKDIMYQCRCRLSGEGEKNISFVDQMRTLWGNQREMLMERMHHQDTHTRDNVMYHLKEARGIPGDKPVRIDNYGQYSSPGDRVRVVQAFDALGYHPRDVMEAMIEHMRQNNDEGNDFRELMLSWMSDNLAQVANLPCPAQHNLNHMRTMARVRTYEAQRLPYTTIDAFMQQYDPDYEAATHSFSGIEAFFAQIMRDPLLTPFWTKIKLPRAAVLQSALDVPLLQAQQQYDAFMRLCLLEGQRDGFDQCILAKVQAERDFAPLEQQFQEKLQDHPQVQRDYRLLKGNDARSEEEQITFEALVKKHAPETYLAKQQVQNETIEQYRGLILQARTYVMSLQQPGNVLQHFVPGIDVDQFQQLQQEAQEKHDAFEDGDFDDAIRATLQGPALVRFNKLVQDEEWSIIEDTDEVELAQIRATSQEYVRLKKEAEQAELALNALMQPFYEKTGAKYPPLPLRAPRTELVLGKPKKVSGESSGARFLNVVFGPIDRNLSSKRGGAIGTDQMKQAFIDHGDSIMIKAGQDQPLQAFLGSPEFQALRGQLGEEFIEQSGINAPELQDQNLNTLAVKQALAALFSDVVLMVSAQPFSRYLSDFQKDAFIPHMRPLKIVDVDGGQQQRNVFERTKGFNPLAMYQMLVGLGELQYKDRQIFQGAFDPLPPEVDVKEEVHDGAPVEDAPAHQDEPVDLGTYAKGAVIILGLFLAYKYVVKPNYPKLVEWWNARKAAPIVDMIPPIEEMVSSIEV